jgi:hypothetical protein
MLILAFISSAHADTTPPEIGITYSPSVVTTEDEVTFTAKASDPSGITKIEILVNAKLVKKCSSSPCVYEGGPYPKGDVSYVANAYDELGNRAWSGYESFVVVEVAKPESMLEIEEIYDTKVKQVKETIAEEELLKELQKVEEEKKRLIEEFAAKMEELELRRVTIIKKLKINKSDVLLDDIKIQAKPVEIDVEGKEVRIEPSPKGLALVEGGIKAEGDVELEYENRTLIALNGDPD